MESICRLPKRRCRHGGWNPDLLRILHLIRERKAATAVSTSSS